MNLRRKTSEGTRAGHSNLRKGDTGVEVKTLQESLNLFFGIVLKVDGVFGDRTEEFVKKFQSACNITVDGIAGQETWLCLDQIKSHIGKSHPTQRKGDKGDYVKYLQVWLNGYYNSQLAVDGNFGSKTEDVVKQFQLQREKRHLLQQLHCKQQLTEKTFAEIHNGPMQTLAFLIREVEIHEVPQQELLEYLRDIYHSILVGVENLNDSKN